MDKYIRLILVLTTLIFSLAKPVLATCPVCILGAGSGLLLAKRLGIDDLLVSIWISGLNTAVAFWLAPKIKKKYLNKPLFWAILFYLFTIVYFQQTKQIWYPGNVLWGIDKVFLGLTLGLLVFFGATFSEQYLRIKNQGKVSFYYQKIIIPLSFLSLTTIIFYFLI